MGLVWAVAPGVAGGPSQRFCEVHCRDILGEGCPSGPYVGSGSTYLERLGLITQSPNPLPLLDLRQMPRPTVYRPLIQAHIPLFLRSDFSGFTRQPPLPPPPTYLPPLNATPSHSTLLHAYTHDVPTSAVAMLTTVTTRGTRDKPAEDSKRVVPPAARGEQNLDGENKTYRLGSLFRPRELREARGKPNDSMGCIPRVPTQPWGWGWTPKNHVKALMVNNIMRTNYCP